MKKILLLTLIGCFLATTAYAVRLSGGRRGVENYGLERFIYLPLTEDLSDDDGELADGTFARASASTYVDPDDGLLKMAVADRDQLIGTSDQNDDTAWPLTIAVAADTTYVLSTNTSGATVTVAEDTATLDGVGSATYGSGNHFVFTCTAAGDVTLSVSGSSTPRAMLEEVPSDLALGPDLTVVGITSANPGVVTITGHGLLTGDYVKFKSLTEMTELNGSVKYVTKIGADTFSVGDTSGYAAETTGGSCANKVPYSVMTSGGVIQPSDYVNSSTIPAQPRYEANGLGMLNASVLNLLPYSEDFSEWTTASMDESFGYLDPAGEMGATKLTVPVGLSTHTKSLLVSGTKDNTIYTFSAFLKRSGTASYHPSFTLNTRANGWKVATFNFTTGAVNASSWDSASITQIGSYYHCVATANIGTGATVPRVYIGITDSGFTSSFAGDGSSGMYVYGANLTETTFLAPYIPSFGAPTAIAAETVSWTLTTALKDVLSDAVGSATSEGTMVVDITLGYDLNAANINVDFVKQSDDAYSLLRSSFDNIITRDSTNIVSDLPNMESLLTVTYAAMWSKSNNTMDLGQKIAGGSWSLGTQTPYDGNHPVTTLRLHYDGTQPAHYKNLRFFRRALSTATIEANF